MVSVHGPDNWEAQTLSLGTDDEGIAIQKAHAILGGIFIVARADEIDRGIDEYLINAQEREKNPMSPDSAKTLATF